MRSYTTDDADRFTKVCLSMAQADEQRHKHLLEPADSTAGHVILHNRDATRESQYSVPKPLEDPFSPYAAASFGHDLVPAENAVDHSK